MSDFLNDSDFQRIRDLIYNESGINFSDSNRTILESRLRERLKVMNLSNAREYYDKLTRDEVVLKEFLDSVTTNLTRFFRNLAHYETFINYVIPDLVEKKRSLGQKKISLWSAGCSTGEEAYTNAMVLKEHLPPDFEIDIVASDLSLKSLLKAKEGFYLNNRVNGIDEKYLKKYFTQEENGYQIKPEVGDLIRFDYHNLKFGSTLRNLDVVFCRNVLIYFDEAAQKNVIDNFWESMSSHSYLFIGHSESLFGMDTQFKFIKTDWACIYGKIQN